MHGLTFLSRVIIMIEQNMILSKIEASIMRYVSEDFITEVRSCNKIPSVCVYIELL